MHHDAFVATAAPDVRDRKATMACDRATVLVHEVNQPLTAILTNAEVAAIWLRRETVDLDEVRLAIDCILANCLRAADVVKTISAQTMPPMAVSDTVDVNQIVEKILDQMGADLRWRRIAIRTDLARDLRTVPGCHVQLEQLVSNLVTNAIEAMDKVSRSRRTLRVVTAGDDRHVRIAVEDSGAGIEPANANRLFEPRFTTKRGGTGIGLSICRTIVEAHGGRLWAAPNIPHGSVFSVAIPARRIE